MMSHFSPAAFKILSLGFPVGSVVKKPPAMQESQETQCMGCEESDTTEHACTETNP